MPLSSKDTPTGMGMKRAAAPLTALWHRSPPAGAPGARLPALVRTASLSAPCEVSPPTAALHGYAPRSPSGSVRGLALAGGSPPSWKQAEKGCRAPPPAPLSTSPPCVPCSAASRGFFPQHSPSLSAWANMLFTSSSSTYSGKLIMMVLNYKSSQLLSSAVVVVLAV